MSLVTLNGAPVARLRMHLPSWGLGWADVELPGQDVALETGAIVALDVSGTAYVCAVASGGVVDGEGRYRLVQGRGGWIKEVPAKSFRNDAGVKAANVLSDAALTVGETLAPAGASVKRLGPHYARRAGPASRVLNDIAPRGWYVDAAGVTQIGAALPSVYVGVGVVTRNDPEARILEIATDSTTGLVPGVSVEGQPGAVDVEYELDESALRVRLYTGGSQSPRVQAVARLVQAVAPWVRYSAPYEFRVVSQTGERVTVQPVRSSSGFDFLEGVPIRAGIPGARFDLIPGTLVLVSFVDADPSRPVVTGFDAPDAPGFLPIQLAFGAPPHLGIAYLGATVQAGPFTGAITLGSATIKTGL